MIRLLIRSTEITFPTSASATSKPTPPRPDSSPLQKNLYFESLPVIIRAEQPFQRDSCMAHKESFLRETVSTISLDLPLIVPTLSEPIRKISKEFVLLIHLNNYTSEHNKLYHFLNLLRKNKYLVKSIFEINNFRFWLFSGFHTVKYFPPVC